MSGEAYWAYQSAFPTPDFAEVPIGCFSGSEREWQQLSPGYRREIVRSFKKMPNYERLERMNRVDTKADVQINAREIL